MGRYYKVIFWGLGIIGAYSCMSTWGMGVGNTIKYYLYVGVVLFSFLLVRELQLILRKADKDDFAGDIFILFTATLILAGFTAVLFSQYELGVIERQMMKGFEQDPELSIKTSF
jgi:hypothetical protein